MRRPVRSSTVRRDLLDEPHRGALPASTAAGHRSAHGLPHRGARSSRGSRRRGRPDRRRCRRCRAAPTRSVRSSSTRQSVPTPRQSQVNRPTHAASSADWNSRRALAVLAVGEQDGVPRRPCRPCAVGDLAGERQPGADRGGRRWPAAAAPRRRPRPGCGAGDGGAGRRVDLLGGGGARDHRERDAVAHLRDRLGGGPAGGADPVAGHRRRAVQDDDLQAVGGRRPRPACRAPAR